MKNKLLKERLKWGAVAAMGLCFSMISSSEKINEPLPDQADQTLKKELKRASQMQLEKFCFLSFPNKRT